jgi:hypothetical protein
MKKKEKKVEFHELLTNWPHASNKEKKGKRKTQIRKKGKKKNSNLCQTREL